jgi:hypothetical protein
MRVVEGDDGVRGQQRRDRLAGDPNIEVVVVRHPDAGTNVSVFENGREVTSERGIFITVIDPGRGWSERTWAAARAVDENAASAEAKSVVTRAYDRYADSAFMTADEDDDE